MTVAPSSPHPVELTGNDLTFRQLHDVAFRGEKVSLARDAVERMQSGPQRAATDREVAARPAPSNHAERILVAVCAQIGTGDGHFAG